MLGLYLLFIKINDFYLCTVEVTTYYVRVILFDVRVAEPSASFLYL